MHLCGGMGGACISAAAWVAHAFETKGWALAAIQLYRAVQLSAPRDVQQSTFPLPCV
jgi:hypothetical protein